MFSCYVRGEFISLAVCDEVRYRHAVAVAGVGHDKYRLVCASRVSSRTLRRGLPLEAVNLIVKIASSVVVLQFSFVKTGVQGLQLVVGFV